MPKHSNAATATHAVAPAARTQTGPNAVFAMRSGFLTIAKTKAINMHIANKVPKNLQIINSIKLSSLCISLKILIPNFGLSVKSANKIKTPRPPVGGLSGRFSFILIFLPLRFALASIQYNHPSSAQTLPSYTAFPIQIDVQGPLIPYPW